MRIILERYLASATHNWSEWRKMYEKECPHRKGVSHMREGAWESEKRFYQREGGILKYKSKNLIFLSIIFISRIAHAFSQVMVSTSAPQGFEAIWLNQQRAEYNVQITSNPLASNTYTMKLFGPNPNYNPSPPPPTTLQQALDLGATVYAYGFVAGQETERHQDLAKIGSYLVNLGTSDLTCTNYIGALENDIYTQYFSTPTVVPGGGF